MTQLKEVESISYFFFASGTANKPDEGVWWTDHWFAED